MLRSMVCSMAVSLFCIASPALAKEGAKPSERYEGSDDDHDPLVATRGGWLHRLRGLEARVRDARDAEEEAERSGDEVQENRAEAVVEAAEEAEARFRDRTTSRSPVMIVAGATLIAGGLASLYVGGISRAAGQGVDDGSDNTASVVAWVVPTAAAIVGGPILLAVGIPRRWRGPAQPEATVGLGAGRVVLRGTF